jgi:acylglycerol lipase
MSTLVRSTTSWEQVSPRVQRFVHHWDPAEGASAAVCIVHGLGEHGGRYQSLAQALAEAGFYVVSFDQQGHGHSPGGRAEVQSYLALLDDIQSMLAWLQTRHPSLPLTLLGHSMGGNLVLNYAIRKASEPGAILPKAVISSSPMIRSVKAPAAWVEFLLRGLLYVAPNHQLKSFIIPERLMSDPDEQRALIEDQLFHNRLTLRLGAALLDSGRWLLEHASELNVPTLLTHGTDDYLTCHLASREFAEKSHGKCRLELLNGQLHDTFRDLNRHHVLSLFIDFLHTHTSLSGRAP